MLSAPRQRSGRRAGRGRSNARQQQQEEEETPEGIAPPQPDPDEVDDVIHAWKFETSKLTVTMQILMFRYCCFVGFT